MMSTNSSIASSTESENLRRVERKVNKASKDIKTLNPSLFYKRDLSSVLVEIPQSFILDHTSTTKEGKILDRYEVVIDLSSLKLHPEEPRVSAFETIFGIIPGKISHLSTLGALSNRVFIVGVVPGSVASQTQIRVGDCILAINKSNVEISNALEVIGQIDVNKKCKLLLQRNQIILDNPSKVKSPRERLTKESRSFIQAEPTTTQSDLSLIEENLQGKLSFSVLYLSLNPEDSLANNVLYQYPNTIDNALNELRGLFITMFSVMASIFNTPSQTTKIIIRGNLLHIAYIKDSENVFVLVFPHQKWELFYVNKIVLQLKQYFSYKYKSLQNTFQNERLKPELDMLFERIMADVQRAQISSIYDQRCPTFAIHKLFLITECKSHVERILSKLESFEFEYYANQEYDLPKPFRFIGSSLFFKDFLVCSHLSPEDLKDMFTYLKFSGTFNLSLANSQAVMWTEVFSARKEIYPNYSRHFLLTILQEQLILCSLLEYTDDEESSEVELDLPDPFYVEQATLTLGKLTYINLGSYLEKSLGLHPGVSFLSFDGPGSKLPARKKSSTSTIPSSYSLIGLAQMESLDSFEMADEFAEYLSNLGLEENIRERRSQRSKFSNYDLGKLSSPSGTQLRSSSSSRLISKWSKSKASMEELDKTQIFLEKNDIHRQNVGSENTLFNFITIDDMHGVFVSPLDLNEGNREITEQFQLCTAKIRDVLSRSLPRRRTKDLHKEEHSSLRQAAIKEHGLLFNYFRAGSPKDQSPIPFWVVGRRVGSPEPREIYICFHDSTPQSIVERAFHLAHSLRH